MTASYRSGPAGSIAPGVRGRAGGLTGKRLQSRSGTWQSHFDPAHKRRIGSFFGDMIGISIRLPTASRAVTAEARTGNQPGGTRSRRAQGPQAHNSDAPFAPDQSFLAKVAAF